MNKIFIVLFAISITTVVSQSCSNFLASDFGIQTLNSTTNETTGLYYCKSLNNSDSCCHATTINGFQQKADDMIARLTSLVSKRDIFLIQKREEVWKLRGDFDRLGAVAEKVFNTIMAQDLIFGRTLSLSYSGIGLGLSTLAWAMNLNITGLHSTFPLYQEKRSQCIIELVRTQAAAWCLACDPYAESKGLSGSTLTFSTELQNRIFDSCGEFILLAAEQNVFLMLHYASKGLDGMIEGLEKISNGDFVGGESVFYQALHINASSLGAFDPPSDEEKVAQLPLFCTTLHCSWIFTDLFYNGKNQRSSSCSWR